MLSTLRACGTFGKPAKLKPGVREQLEAEARAKFEAELRAAHPGELEAAVAALDKAGAFVLQDAVRLRELGFCLSPGMLSSTALLPRDGATPLDVLKTQTNRVRAAAEAFEAALKRAGVMKTVTRQKSARPQVK